MAENSNTLEPQGDVTNEESRSLEPPEAPQALVAAINLNMAQHESMIRAAKELESCRKLILKQNELIKSQSRLIDDLESLRKSQRKYTDQICWIMVVMLGFLLIYAGLNPLRG